jgi:hypothetical protein
MSAVRASTKLLGWCVGIAASVAICAPTVASAGQLPAWLVLRPGAVAYLASQGDDSDPPGQRVVCNDLSASKRLGSVDDLLLKPIGTAENGCFVRRAYGLVRVKRIVAHSEAIGVSRIPIVAVTSLSDGWSGITIGLALLPIIPRGVELTQQRGAYFFRSRAIEFVKKRVPVPKNGYIIDRPTTVRVLRQNVPDDNHNDLYVRVLTGAHRGTLVWTTLNYFPASNWMQDPANVIP